MAGFEVVVRPVVFPNIRPAPARSLPPADDPEQNMCVIRGNPASSARASYTYNQNVSRSKNVETERRVDKVRVKHMDDDGTVDDSQFLDVDVATRIRSRGGKAPMANNQLKSDGTPNYGGGTSRGDRIVNYYKRAEEAKNIEIKERDIIQKNPQSGE